MKGLSPFKLSVETRASLFLQLSQLEQAGFPAQQAFKLLDETQHKAAKRVQLAQKQLKLGRSIADSGYKSGLFDAFDSALIRAGETSGKLAAIYQQLAAYYANKEKRLRSVKSKLSFPIAIAVLAIFIQPIPLLFLNKITSLEYLSVTIGLIIKLLAICYILYFVFNVSSNRQRPLFGLVSFIHIIQIQLPVVSNWIKKRQINTLLNSLGLMLSAGVSAVDAFPKALGTIKNSHLRSRFSHVQKLLASGNSLAESLRTVPEISNDIIQQLIIAESSGKLDEVLLHYSKIEEAKLALKEELVAEWIPRVIYLIIMIAMARSIINSNAFMPTVV